MSMNFGIAEYWYDLYDFLLENTLHKQYILQFKVITMLTGLYIFLDRELISHPYVVLVLVGATVKA